MAIMDVARTSDDEQAARWNGVAGRAWIDAQDLLDGVFKPLEDLLVEEVAAVSRGRVLDVGCGTGGTTIAAARRLGSKARCIGIDISEPMIAAARARAEREGVAAEFIRANSQVHAFEPASIDMLISRFGVMFFDDPVQAFANLRRGASDNARMQLIAWRSAEDNPFMTTAERAAVPLLPDLPPRRRDGPGQFAFADSQRVSSILQKSGWAEIEMQSIDIACTLPESAVVHYLTRLGPVGLALQQADDATRTRVVEAIRPAFDPYVHGPEVRFSAACWMIGARAL